MSELEPFIGRDHARALADLWITTVTDLLAALNEDQEAVNRVLDMPPDVLQDLRRELEDVRRRDLQKAAAEAIDDASLAQLLEPEDFDDRPRKYGARDPKEE